MTEQLQTRHQDVAEEAAKEPLGENGSSESPAPFKVFATKEAYQEHFDKILGQRLRNARKNEEKLERLEALLQEQKAVRQPIDSANAVSALEKELDVLSQQDSALYSEINAGELAADRKFLTLLAEGLTVKEAYHALHPEAVSRILAERAGKQIVDNIRARGNRPNENVITGGVTGAMSPNVAAMNNDEIDALLERVRRGESISF